MFSEGSVTGARLRDATNGLVFVMPEEQEE